MTQNELLQLIHRAAREGWIELNLRGQKIKKLPSEIGQLTHLAKLDLSNNQLKSLPESFDNLTNLTYLDISGNNFDLDSLDSISAPALMEVVCDLQQFTSIVAEQEIPIEPVLRSDQTISMPMAIKQLNPTVWSVRVDETTIFPLIMDLPQEHLTMLPPEIGQLTSLLMLGIFGGQLTTLPPEIGQLTNLQSLNISGNQLTTLPPEIGQLTNLRLLDCGNNQLATIPSEIGRLSNLHFLDLDGNQLTAIPPEIGQLSNLQDLRLSFNQLTAVPSELGQLTTLQKLDLSGNQLTAIPPQIGRLSHLQEFSLSFNRLTTLPPEISQLTSLQLFYLHHNDLTTTPPQIGQLANLQELYLGDNQITTVSPEIGNLTNLQKLDLRENQITILPTALRYLQRVQELHLYKNPLPIPPELLGHLDNPGNPQTILDAYFQASRPLHEAKLLLVGEGSVGKTSLVERLLWGRPPSDSGKTIGVDIHRWQTSHQSPTTGQQSNDKEVKLQLNIWDFGGQEIYHATHQFFLTHRSLYLLVLEARKDEGANRLDYWLRHIQSFAGDAPIILVVNKSEQGRLALDERGLQLKHPTIQAIIHTSCTTGAGIPQLHQAIQQALSTMPHLNDCLPLAWFNVKEKLSDLDKDTLPYESYLELCKAEGIKYKAAQDTLSRFLHDLGAALHFQDDRRLAGTHVLNPEWVTGGIYHILNAPELQERGTLHLSNLDNILDPRRYPSHKHPFLLDIMHKFELCVPLEDGQRYLIPGLLPKERPAFEWSTTGTIALEYRYAILPASILARLMVRLHRHTWQITGRPPARWRNGLVLARDGCRALVIADPADARLTIALDGPTPYRRHLLSLVRGELAEIHASFVNMEAAEWVPIPGKMGKAIQYAALCRLEEKGVNAYYDPVNDMELNVQALLDGIETPGERAEVVLQRKLVEWFNREELRQLCFEMLIDYEDFPNESKTVLARGLVQQSQKQGRLRELMAKVERERPNMR